MNRTDVFPFAPAAGWKGKGFAFLAIAGFLILVTSVVFAEAVFLRRFAAATPENTFAESEWAMALAVVVGTFLMAWMRGRHFGDYGLGGRKKGRNFLAGISAGIALLAVQLLTMKLAGTFSFGIPAIGLKEALAAGGFCAVTYLGVALFEETAFRGYVLAELSQAVSFWPAALLLALLFGGAHLLNGGTESLMAAGMAGLFGLVLAILFRLTGSLWLSIGIHAGWDFGESFLFGVPDSGTVSTVRLMQSAAHGPDWLSGGAAGPEGSVFVLLPLAAFLLIGAKLGRRRF